MKERQEKERKVAFEIKIVYFFPLDSARLGEMPYICNPFVGKRHRMRKKIIIALWLLFALVVGAVAWAFWAIGEGRIGYMPNLYQLENPVNKFASQVLSSDGRLLGTWSYQRTNRVFLSYNDISPTTIQALVATEDIRFYEHSGIDFRALGRAFVKRGLMRQKNAGGGSTITQQLRLAALRSACFRNLSSGPLLSSWSVTTLRRKSLRCTSTTLTSCIMP